MRRQQSPVEVRWPASGVFLLESHHRDDFRMAWRSDPFHKVLYFLKGAGVLQLPDAPPAELSAPAVARVPRDTRHRIRDTRGAPLSLYGLCLHPERFVFAELAADVCARAESRPGLPAADTTTARLRRLLQEQTRPREHSRESVAALAGQLLVELARSNPGAVPQPDARARVAAYSRELEETFFEKDTLEAAASRAGLGVRRFSALFREHNGTSWQRRVTDLRIRHAASMLADGRHAVKSVAFACGFDDLAHFYRVFKARKGTTPGDYAKHSAEGRG